MADKIEICDVGLTLAIATADYAARTRTQARHCIVVAVVAPAPIAAELIDEAVSLAGTAVRRKAVLTA